MIAIARSPTAPRSSFALDCWVSEASPGAGVANDAAPTTLASVPATRICTINAFRRGALQLPGAGLIRMLVVGGTTLVTQTYFYDYVLNGGQWVPWGPNVTITVATTNVGFAGNVTIGAMSGAKFYVRIVSSTGTPSNFGYVYT